MATIDGTNGNDNLSGVPGESNILNLNAGNDIEIGAVLDDILNGNEGDDLLGGGGNTSGADGEAFFVAADDILDGDEGEDTLSGGVFIRLPNGQLVRKCILPEGFTVILNRGI